MPFDKKYIRFIDSSYKTLFHLPDGGRIRLTRPDGRQLEHVCHFIDEYHTKVGSYAYHICEFAEHMERSGTKYEPVDYIRDPEFYKKHFFLADEKSSGPVYRIIDETEAYGFAYASKGAPKGKKYCIFIKVPDGPGRGRIGKVTQWGGALKDIRPKDWGFDLARIKAVTQRPRPRDEPER